MKVSHILVAATAGLLPFLGFSTTLTDSFQGYTGSDPLQSATFTVTLNVWDAYYAVDNDSADPINNAQAWFSSVANSFSTPGTLLSSSVDFSALKEKLDFSVYSPTFSLTADNGDADGTKTINPDIAGKDYFSWSPATHTVSYSVLIDDKTVLQSLLGGKTFDVNMDLTFKTDTNITGATVYSFLGNPQGVLDAQITYQAIPEASTYALLLGAGTLGLVGWRRFRRK